MFGTKKPILFLLLGLAAICTATNDTVETNETTVKVNPEPPVSSTTIKPPTKPTTPSTTTPTTTPVTSTTVTTPSTSTSTPPPTTPTTPKTSTTPNTPTTPVPTPTTQGPVTTPKPVPFDAGTWEVLNDNKTACILLHMKGVIDVYHYEGNQTNVEQIQIPQGAVANGTCTEPEQKIVLSWNFNVTLNNTVEIVFKKNESKFDLETLNVSVIVIEKNLTKWLNLTRVKEEFETPVTMSYKCKKTQMMNFTDSATNETLASLMISDVQFQAFGDIKERTFASAKDCEPYETPDIVPIAVGCALIALIVFVLIGYLIGRRRNQTRGYLSMVEE